MALKVPKSRQRQLSRSPSGVTNHRQIQRSRQMAINIPLIIITGIIGVASWAVEEIVYSALVDNIPRFLLIGVLFSALCLVLCVTVYLYSKTTGVYEQNILTGHDDGIGTVLYMAFCMVVVFLAAILFQWIYGLNLGTQITEPTSYIFLIDDSGSMQENDPSQERYSAIYNVLEDMPDTFEYMVYGFSNDSHIVRRMAPVSEGVQELSGNSSGGTAIKAALNQVLDDYENGIWNGGTNPKLILLTDGYATDIGFFSPINKVLRRYVSAHISVSTVGLGDVDSSLLARIAKTTGGVFVDVEYVSELSEAMRSAATEYTARDLLSTRYQPSLNLLFGLLRVVFLTILGVGIGFVVAIAYGLHDTVSLTLASSLVTSFLGALIMELGTGLLGLSDRLMWLILWGLIAVTVAVKITNYRDTVKRTLRKPIMSPNKSARKISNF